MVDDKETMQTVMVNQVKWTKRDSLHKSLRLFNPVVQIGLNGDDFVKNINTVRILFDAYKIPRFLKKRLPEYEDKKLKRFLRYIR